MPEVQLDLTELEELAKQLAELDGVRSVVTDPSQLVLPGAWMQVLGFSVDTLSAADWRIDLNLVLAVSDTNAWRAAVQLVELLNVLRPAVGNPPGPFTPRTLVLPDGNTRVPALDLPITVRLTAAPDEPGEPTP